MHPHYKEPEDCIICPECGSKAVKEDEDNEVKSKMYGQLKQYKCGDCHCLFIPAAVITKSNGMMDDWSAKVRMNEGCNNKPWKEVQDFIIIRKKTK